MANVYFEEFLPENIGKSFIDIYCDINQIHIVIIYNNYYKKDSFNSSCLYFLYILQINLCERCFKFFYYI